MQQIPDNRAEEEVPAASQVEVTEDLKAYWESVARQIHGPTDGSLGKDWAKSSASTIGTLTAGLGFVTESHGIPC